MSGAVLLSGVALLTVALKAEAQPSTVLRDDARIGITLGATAAGFLVTGLIAGFDPPGADPWEIDPVLFFGVGPLGATALAGLTSAYLAPPGRAIFAAGGALLGGLLSYGMLLGGLALTDLNFAALVVASLLSIPVTVLSAELFRSPGGQAPVPSRGGPLSAAFAFRF